VVAGLRFLQAREVVVELLLGQERRAIDALEHRVLLVALPVRSGRVRELEDAEPPRRSDVRSAAEVDELALPVAGDPLSRGDPPRDLDLEPVALLLEDPDRLLDRHLEPLDRVVLRDDLPHFGFDRREVLGSKRALRVEVVVVAVLDRRADPDLHVGEEPFHGLRGQVRRRVPVDGDGVRRFRGEDLERAVLLERCRQVHDSAVELARPGVASEPRADRLRDGAHGRPLRDLPPAPVRKRDRHLLGLCFHSAFRRKKEERGSPRVLRFVSW
jgi:hypothetical protein